MADIPKRYVTGWRKIPRFAREKLCFPRWQTLYDGEKIIRLVQTAQCKLFFSCKTANIGFFGYGFYMIGDPQNMYIIAKNSVIYNNKILINTCFFMKKVYNRVEKKLECRLSSTVMYILTKDEINIIIICTIPLMGVCTLSRKMAEAIGRLRHGIGKNEMGK